MPVVEGRISGRTGNVSVLRDTGCSGGIIRRSMCSEDSFTEETRTCVMINGDTFTAPVVNIMVDTPYCTGRFNELSVEKPVYDIVVGNIPGARDANDPNVNWRPDVDTSDGMSDVRTELDITASTDVSCVVTTRASKVEKRMKPLHVVKSREVEIDSKELQRLQENDPSQNKITTWIDEGKGQRSRPKWEERFYLDKSIMYREHETSAKKGSVSTTQLVLPANLREGVMEVAHDSILGGHLGGKKTLDRVTSNFHWPGVADNVQRYVQSCDICQRTIPKGRNVKVLLGDMPIIGTAFEIVAIDLVVPLVKSHRKHRWILTMIDFATRYPIAIPMTSIETVYVAEALVSIFAGVGIPREILSDRGSQFYSHERDYSTFVDQTVNDNTLSRNV